MHTDVVHVITICSHCALLHKRKVHASALCKVARLKRYLRVVLTLRGVHLVAHLLQARLHAPLQCGLLLLHVPHLGGCTSSL
jgi:hypothetical protein